MKGGRDCDYDKRDKLWSSVTQICRYSVAVIQATMTTAKRSKVMT